MKLFVIEEGALLALAQAAKRLHSEDRLNGDEMRDLGHTLATIVRNCEEVPIPETDPS